MSKAQGNSIIDTTCQFSIVHLPDYYKEKGVIFSKNYIVGIEMQNMQSRYTPTKDDIAKAETILNDTYNKVQNTNIDIKTFFCHWVRQYIGLIDNNGNKNIIVQLIDNTKPGRINRLLGKGWETVFIVMLSDNFYAVSRRFKINIDTGEISSLL